MIYHNNQRLKNRKVDVSNGDYFACFEMSTDDAPCASCRRRTFAERTPQRWTPLMVQADKQVDAAFGAVKNQMQAAIVQHMTEAAINCQAGNRSSGLVAVDLSLCVLPFVSVIHSPSLGPGCC